MVKMGAKQRLYNSLKIIICLFGLVTTFYAVVEFTYFLSFPNHAIKRGPFSKDPGLNVFWALLVNMSLLSLFIMQHSLLAMESIKEAFTALELQVIYRSLYVITTSGTIMVLIRHWKSTPDVIMWEINLNSRLMLWSYYGIHLMAWLLIYVGNIFTDISELLGIKQVYYSCLYIPDPILSKSPQLRRLYSHMRHPSFLAFIILFWLYPIMSLDRLQFAIVLTSYMYLAWNVDNKDKGYLRYQTQQKNSQLANITKYYKSY